ncbi:DUF3021 domain-containing protein [Limosilactobacillus caccae]|uniref:DUF3021 domain-containing protein n=1 Tax=Limosilactobacillus caccae TaxID=1926284 RepID=UPI00097147C4|nr:DUF3021 domain-containing protein [Limosilactobacillus caccae]
MMKQLRNGLSFAAHGVLIGMAISIFFSYLSGTNNYYPSAPAFMAQFASPLNALVVSIVLWAVMGLLFGYGALIFERKRWSLRKQTAVNFLVYYCGFSPLAIAAGWFSLTITNFVIFTAIFIAIYAICWVIGWFIGRKTPPTQLVED